MANTKYFTVTVPSTEVPSDQTDVSVYLDLSVLAASHGFFTNARSDAGDVRIYNVTGTKTEVPREIVDYDAVAETGEIHFLADSLLSATDNVFQVEYGDGTLTDYLPTDTFGAEAVWVNHYFVSHDGGYNDSSGNRDQGILGNGITIGGATGKLGSATLFDKANSEYIEIGSDVVAGNVALLPASDDFTIQIWLNQFNVTGTGVADESLVYTQNRTGATDAFFMYGCGARNGHVTQIYERLTNDIHLQGADIRATGWRKWEIVRDSVNLTSYIDDVLQAQRTAIDFGSATRSYVGAYHNNPVERFYTGEVDEIRVTHQALSADFREIEYANQNDPASFYTLSAEQDIGGGGGTTYDESFSIGQSNDLSPMGNIIVDDAIEIGQQSGILEESTLEGIASFALSNQNIISLASQLLAEDAVQINQVSSVTVNGGLTVEDSFTLALQNAMSFEATEAVVVSFSLGSQSSVTTEGQLDAQGSIDLVQASGLTLLDQLDASGTFVLNMQVAIGLLANAIVEAGLSISSLSEITVTGQSITSNVTLPDGRTLKIKLENRTLTIEKDNRTLDIS